MKMMAAGAAIIAVGCSNPTKDYDDFRDRIGALTDASTIDSGVDTGPVTRDGSVFDEAGVAGFSGDFFGMCLDKSYAGDITAGVGDSFHLEFVQAADGTVSVSGHRKVLVIGATNTSQTAGAVINIPPTPVDANGSFAAHVATFITPKEANIFGFDLTVENGVYNFTAFSPASICGHFIGNVTAPIPQEVDETCILRRPNPDGSFTPITNAADIHCP